VKTKFIESKQVDASAIQIETLKGTVQLSGFAKSAQEKSTAEQLAKKVEGVKAVKNDIIVRP
jgi:osmotically-inducible protein OsmY